MKLKFINTKISGSNRRFILDQIQQYADRFADRKFSAIDIVNLYDGPKGCHAVNVYDTHGNLAFQKIFNSLDMLVGYVLGANTHMSKTHVIKELDA